ncbi:MAG: restriction endonuclease [Planctomycetes bacterium]|nr:restriction endonuclease [Planctomycetota bacterium]
MDLFSQHQEPETLNRLLDLADSRAVLNRLQAVDWEFTREKTTYLSHDLHPYPAKFIPQIPAHLIQILSLPGELVLDPFGGSGTTALEALLAGRAALSVDVNPLAKIIGEAKTLTLNKEEIDALNEWHDQLTTLSSRPRLLERELTATEAAYRSLVPDIPNMSDWFCAPAVRELAFLRWQLERLSFDKCAQLAKAVFSRSILKASNQDSETRYTHKPKDLSPGFTVRVFAANLAGALRKIQQLGRRLQFRKATFVTLDLREESAVLPEPGSPVGLRENSVDLIVTSPPYPNATDYHLYHRFRLFWLGFDPRDLARKEIGSHLRHQKESTGFAAYLQEMKLCLQNLLKVLRPGRYAVLVLGDGIFDKQVCATSAEVARAAEQVGFAIAGSVERKVHATRRSFISAARRLTSEHLLVLRKPCRDADFTFQEPSYQLWDYERELRTREIQVLLGPDTRRKAHVIQATMSPLLIDRARQLTFTRSFHSESCGEEPTWQAILENGEPEKKPSRKKDPKYATHGLHPYKGKFYPQLAKSLLNLAQVARGESVLDPFCGSGTVLLEAYLNGYKGYGVDLNPLAVKIARVKTQILEVDPCLRDRLLGRFQERLQHMEASERWLQLFEGPLLKELLSWFPGPVLAKLGWLKKEITRISEPRVVEFLEVLISSLVRQVSQQDPRDLRIRRRTPPLEDAPVAELLCQRLADQRKRLQTFAERSSRAPCRYLPARAIDGDCRDAHLFGREGIEPDSIRAIITSPPYATALPYIDTDRLSLLLLFDLNAKKRSCLEEALIGTREIKKKLRAELETTIAKGQMTEVLSDTATSLITEIYQKNHATDVGFRRKNLAALLYGYYRDMSRVFANLAPLLQENGSAFFVIGDNKTVAGGQTVPIPTGNILGEIGVALGWRFKDRIPITVTTENRVHSKNSITRNEILWFTATSAP